MTFSSRRGLPLRPKRSASLPRLRTLRATIRLQNQSARLGRDHFVVGPRVLSLPSFGPSFSACPPGNSSASRLSRSW